MGNSLGGWISASYALQHPGKVDRIVLVDAAGIGLSQVQASKGELMGLNPSTLAGFRQLMGMIFYNKTLLTEQKLETGFAANISKGHGLTINAFVDSIGRGEDFLDTKLGQVQTPTLIIWGREDGLAPLSMGEAYKAGISGSEMRVINKCGHIPQIECAASFNSF